MIRRKIKRVAEAGILIAAVFLAAPPWSEGGEQDFPPEFATAKIWMKLEDSARQAWLAAKQSGDMDRRFDCIVRVRAPYDPGDRAFMEGRGMSVQVAAGTMVRGHMKAKDVPDVAGLPFVSEVNLWTPKTR